MTEVKRVNPRRPYRLSPEGLRRIVLGEASSGAMPSAAAPGQTAAAKPSRPRRQTTAWHVAIARSDRGNLDEHARQAIAAAAILAQPSTGVLAIILGPFAGDAGALGADAVLVLADFADSYQPEREAALCARLVEAYDARLVVLPDKQDGDGDLGRRLIAAHGGNGATHVVELSAKHVTIRWSGGRELARAPLPRFVLIEPGAVDANLPFTGAGDRTGASDAAAVAEQPCSIRDLGLETVDLSRIALEEADIVVSAGNGVANVATLEALARALGAVVGASRVAVDEGKLQRHQQVGATGKTVSATTYVAVGISGAVQHLQGIKDCRHVIAINRDPGAPIAQRADLTVAGDAEAVMQALLALIKAAREAASSREAA